MLLLWALLSCAYMQICPKYICSATPSTQNLCNILTEDPNGIPIFNLYNVTCSLQDEYCNFSYELNNPDKCVAYSNKLPGERCYSNAECRSQSCSMCHNVCIGLTAGSKCALHDDCEIGHYCDADGTCKKWKVEGETCGNGVECASYLVCEANICIVAGSIKVGQPAFTPMSCESFFTYEVTPGNFQCVSGPTLQSAQNCPNNNLCQYNLKLANGSVSSLSESCECSLDAQGTSYCQKGEGDYTKEINYFLSYLRVRKPYCHISKKYFCNNVIEDLTMMRAYVSYQNIFREVQYQGANSCVLPNIDGKYAEYKKILENYQTN